jgi:hypothetical protein
MQILRFLFLFLFALVALTPAAHAVDLGTYTIHGVPSNQPPSGYDGHVITTHLLPRDQGGIVAALPNAVYNCAYTKAQIQIESGWPRAVVELSRAGWSAPPATTTCSATVGGVFYTLNLVIDTVVVDYSNRITDFSAGLNLALGSEVGAAGSWSVLPNAGAYTEETLFATKGGATWNDAKCRVVAGTLGRYWLRFEVNDTGTCTAAQDCRCKYKLVGGSYQTTPIVVSR